MHFFIHSRYMMRLLQIYDASSSDSPSTTYEPDAPSPVESTNNTKSLRYEAAASLMEFELKKILLDKIENSKSYRAAQAHKELYDRLVKSYNLDKDLYESYGLKKQKTSKEAESTKISKSKESRSSSLSKGTKSQTKSSGKSAQAEEPVFEPADTKMPQNQGDNLENTDDQANVEAASRKDWFKKPEWLPTPDPDWNASKSIDFRPLQTWISNIPKARTPPRTCKSRVELEYHFEECYKAVTDRLDWNNLEGHEYPFDLGKPLPLVEDRGRQVVPVNYFINNDLEYLKGGSSSKKYTTSTTKTKAAKYDNIEGIEDMVLTLWSLVKYDYGYLEEIVVRREDNLLCTFREGDFPNLNLHDIEDMLLLLVQKKLSNLEKDVRIYEKSNENRQKQANTDTRMEERAKAGSQSQKKSNLQSTPVNLDMRYMKPLNLFQDLLKIPAVERGRLLGLDVGDKYVGLAVSDFDNKVASPLRLVKSYNLDKDLYESYGKRYSLKRDREDKDKDEDPPGSDQGLKKQKTSKEAESIKISKSKESRSSSLSKGTKSQTKSSGKSAQAEEQKDWLKKPEWLPTPDPDWNASKSIDFRPPQTWISNILKARTPPRTCKSRVELEYHFEECYKAVTDRLDWNNPEGHEYPFDLGKPLPLVEDRGRQVVPVNYFINNDLEYLKGESSSKKYTASTTKTKAAKYDNIEGIEDMVLTLWSLVKYDYGYLEEIVVRREDNLLCTFREAYQCRITNVHQTYYYSKTRGKPSAGSRKLPKEAQHHQTRDIRSDISKFNPYIAYKNPQVIIYLDKYKRNRLMRSDELYKFCDGTLTSVRTVLHDIANNLRMDYLPKRRWSNLDRKRSRIMIKAIDQQLFERRLNRNLERFVGGRDYKTDLRLIERII
ncbi:ribonuclease H-like domain-containing protein [Tanacetum coccineum]|uniref:Ribonuclease H-like domain-containing protein n=1 Tax=Tanacetum coccineum TaxID=301880 RepID=A0ABQ5CIZ0_9ASTR